MTYDHSSLREDTVDASPGDGSSGNTDASSDDASIDAASNDDSGSNEDAGDAGGPEDECSGQPDGTVCDDRDVCTPRSVCRDGACFGANPNADCIVADTVADFGETQGENGWFYGSWDADGDADGRYDPDEDFEPMVFCGSGTWRATSGGCSGPPDGGQEWTMNLSSGLQHAEVRDALELPVRRWVSDVSGPATLWVEHQLNASSVGDGTRALLLLDGEEIWRNEAAPGDERLDTLEVTLEVGTRVEQLLHPLATQADDMTYFSIQLGR